MQILGVIGSSTFPGIPNSDFFSIATVTATDSSSSTLTISNIPTGYKHLHLRYMVNNSNGAADADIRLRFNSDSGNNYSWKNTYSTAVTPHTTSYGDSQTGVNAMPIARATANAQGTLFGYGVAEISDYSSTSKAKSVSAAFGNTRGVSATSNQYVFSGGGVWTSTSAITSISFINLTTNFGVNSKVAIYGLK